MYSFGLNNVNSHGSFLQTNLAKMSQRRPWFLCSPLPSSWVFQLVDAGCRIMPRRHLKQAHAFIYWDGFSVRRRKKDLSECFQRCTHPCHHLSFSISFFYRLPVLCPPFIWALWWYSHPWEFGVRWHFRLRGSWNVTLCLSQVTNTCFWSTLWNSAELMSVKKVLENAEAFIFLNILLWKTIRNAFSNVDLFASAVSAVIVCITKVHQNECFGEKISF